MEKKLTEKIEQLKKLEQLNIQLTDKNLKFTERNV